MQSETKNRPGSVILNNLNYQEQHHPHFSSSKRTDAFRRDEYIPILSGHAAPSLNSLLSSQAKQQRILIQLS